MTGQTFACPAEAVDDLIAFCAARGVPVTAEPFDAQPGLRVIRGSTGTTGKFTPRVWVSLATAFFVAGQARVLVGTRALLGEGWDCAAVNVTVDLTSATTQAAVTQMRGRALRRDPSDAQKVADNWSVCCVAAEHPRGDADYLRLVRKHDAYFAATPQGLIESGVTHCDPTLSPYGPPSPADARAVTARALQHVAERAQATTWWRIGEPYEGRDVATIRIRSERPLGIATPGTPESALSPTIPGHRRFGSARARLVAGLSGLGAGAGGVIAAATLGPLGAAATVGAVAVAGVGLLASGTATESRRLAEAPNALEQLAAVVADGLKAAGGAERGAEAVRITPDADGWIRCELSGVAAEQAQLFSAVLDELLAPLTEPRYLIGRKILLPPPAGLARTALRRARSPRASATRRGGMAPGAALVRPEPEASWCAAVRLATAHRPAPTDPSRFAGRPGHPGPVPR